MNAADFYAAASPLVERLLCLARQWRDAAPTDEDAIREHGEWMWTAIRCDLRRTRAGVGMAVQTGEKP